MIKDMLGSRDPEMRHLGMIMLLTKYPREKWSSFINIDGRVESYPIDTIYITKEYIVFRIGPFLRYCVGTNNETNRLIIDSKIRWWYPGRIKMIEL